MKTQKEIDDRIQLHQERVAYISNKLADEQIKFFKNRQLIKELRDQLLQEQTAIVLLSWTTFP